MATPTLPPFEEALTEFHAKGNFLMLAGRTAGSAEELWQIYTQNGVEVDRNLLPREQVTIDRIALLEANLTTAESLLTAADTNAQALQAQVDELSGKLATAEAKVLALQAQVDELSEPKKK